MSMKEQIDFSSAVKALKSGAVIAVFIGLPCYLLQLRVPSVAAQALQYVADMNTPLAMLIAGATTAQTNVLNILKKPRNYLVCFYKLLLVPLAVFAVIRWFNLPTIVVATVTIATACPLATTCIMFALSLDKNAEKGSEIFSMSTLLSALTLPVVTIIATTFA